MCPLCFLAFRKCVRSYHCIFCRGTVCWLVQITTDRAWRLLACSVLVRLLVSLMSFHGHASFASRTGRNQRAIDVQHIRGNRSSRRWGRTGIRFCSKFGAGTNTGMTLTLAGAMHRAMEALKVTSSCVTATDINYSASSHGHKSTSQLQAPGKMLLKTAIEIYNTSHKD